MALGMIGLLVQLMAAERAPMGYQDETGFHYGTPEGDPCEGTKYASAPNFAFQTGRRHGPTPRRAVAVSAHHA